MTRISDERLEELIAGHEAFKRCGDTSWNFASDEEELSIFRELRAYRKEGRVWEPLYPTQDAFDAGLSQLPKGTTTLNLQACWNAMVEVMQRDYRAMLAAAPEPQEGP